MASAIQRPLFLISSQQTSEQSQGFPAKNLGPSYPLVDLEDVYKGLLPPIYGNKPLTFFEIMQGKTTEARPWQEPQNLIDFRMAESVRALVNEVAELKVELQQLRKERTFVVPITTLAPQPFQVTQQIPVTIEGDGEDFTATFMEANISASGETEADAIANFKDSLLSSYAILERIHASQLGPLPTRQWEILKSVVKRIE